MRVTLLLNPGSGRIDDPDGLAQRMRERVEDVDVHDVCEVDVDALDLAGRRVVVAGGDGSIGPVFEAVAAAGGAQLAVIPGGTANDFARAMGIPLGVDEAAALAADPGASTQEVWGGCIAGRPFVNAATVGLSSRAAELAEPLKPYLRQLAYPAGAVRSALSTDPVRLALSADGEMQREGRAWQLMIGQTGRFGGGSGLGQANPLDADLDAAWVPAGSRLTLPVTAVLLRRRRIEEQDGVERWTARSFAVRATHHGRPASWNVDGERWTPPSERVEITPLGPVELVRPSRPANAA